MEDVIDCETCSGSGKIPFPSYRSSARSGRLKTPEEREAEEKKKKEREENRIILKNIFWGCVAFPFVIAGCTLWAHGCNASAKEDAFNANKSGILLVEYDGDNRSVHCYVEREGTYYTGNPQKVAKINNRHDDQDIADVAKILNWDETTQGKCYRFKYDFDTK